MSLILASSSPFRKDILIKLGLPFVTTSPNIDESRNSSESPYNLVTRLSEEKALKASKTHSGLIIASDQVATLDTGNKKTDKIFIVESHPREAGFNLFYLTCKKITGLDLYQISVKAKLNQKLYLKDIKSKDIFNNYCTRMIPVEKSGIIKKIFLKKFNDKKEIKTYVKIFKKKGDVIENKNNDASRIGYIQSFTSNKKMNLEKYTYKILKKYLTINYY